MTSRSSILCSIAVLCVSISVASSPARAQHVGTYSGFQANGQPFSLSVMRYKGQLIVEDINVQVQTTRRDGQSLVSDTGYAPVGPIVNGSGKDSFNFGTTYFSESFTFDDATRSVSGFVKVIFSIFKAPPVSSPGFPPGSVAPAKSTYYSSGNQAYAAVLGKDVAFDPHAKVLRFRRPQQ